LDLQFLVGEYFVSKSRQKLTEVPAKWVVDDNAHESLCQKLDEIEENWLYQQGPPMIAMD